MRVGTLIKIIVGLIVLVVIVAVVAVLVIDPNDYKDELVAAVEEKTGRELTIGGDIKLNLGFSTWRAVADVRFTNADWGSLPDMVSVGAFEAEVALLPLIGGDLVIDRLVLRDADISIETDANGRLNLDFAAAARDDDDRNKPDRDVASSRDDDDAADDAAKQPRIGDVLVENARLTIIDAVAGKTTESLLARLSVRADSLSDPLTIDVADSATLDGQAIDFSITRQVAAPGLLVDGGQPFSVKIAATALGLDLRIDGTIAEPAAARGIAIKLAVAGANLDGLKPFVGDGLSAAGPIDLKATITGDGDNVTLDDLVLGFGRTDLRGRTTIDLRGAGPRLDASFEAGRIDLVELMPAGAGDDASAATLPSGAMTRAGGREEATQPAPAKVLPADELVLDGLRAADAKLSFSAGQLIAPGASLTDVRAELTLDNGALAIRPLAAKIAGSPIDADISLDTRSGRAVLAAEVKAPALDLGANGS